MSKIIYPTDTSIAVLHPTGELPVEQVALKDVPAGVPFLIIDDADVPDDRTYRGAWMADFSSSHGQGMGHYGFQAHICAQQAQEAANGPQTILSAQSVRQIATLAREAANAAALRAAQCPTNDSAQLEATMAAQSATLAETAAAAAEQSV